MTPSDENKMPELFDTWGHKFGMAYTNSEGRVLYVENFSHSLGFVVFYLGADGNFDERERFPRSRKLRRAPEYDLIPAKSHTELSEIAGEMEAELNDLASVFGKALMDVLQSDYRLIDALASERILEWKTDGSPRLDLKALTRHREFMKGKGQ